MSTHYTIVVKEEEAKNSLQNEFYLIKLWFYENQMVLNASKCHGIYALEKIQGMAFFPKCLFQNFFCYIYKC